MLLSFAAYALFALYFFGMLLPDPAGDEGLGAHLFWLLMGFQIPFVLYFMFKWLRQNPREGSMIFALQGALWILAWVPVWYFQL